MLVARGLRHDASSGFVRMIGVQRHRISHTSPHGIVGLAGGVELQWRLRRLARPEGWPPCLVLPPQEICRADFGPRAMESADSLNTPEIQEIRLAWARGAMTCRARGVWLSCRSLTLGKKAIAHGLSETCGYTKVPHSGE